MGKVGEIVSKKAFLKDDHITRATINRLNSEAKKIVAAVKTSDSFQNFMLNLGIGTDNPTSGSTYGFNPITRQRTLLEWIHRGSWLGGIAIDVPAEDMSRAGIEITSNLPKDSVQTIESAAMRMNIWPSIGENTQWSRLYGGSIAVHMIDGQDMRTPLNGDSIGRNQYKGLYVLDRWMVEPSLGDLVTDVGAHLGQPKYYRVCADAPAWRGQIIHHSRVALRQVGIPLPYWQRVAENMWGISVLERLYDRMVAFDSATTGASQLVYKSHLRTLALEGFRQAAVAGGDALKGITRQVDMMRRMQSQEGISLIDAKDHLQVDQVSSFSGISDALMQFGQQLSGALQIPMVRMFGQSPAGLSSTGESDLRTYYDGISSKQNSNLRNGVGQIYRFIARSEGIILDERAFNFDFRPLWLLTESDRATIANTVTTAVVNANEAGLIGQKTAMKELQQSARETGVFSSITNEDIESAEEIVPEIPEEAAPGIEDSRTGDSLANDDYAGLPIVIESPKGSSRGNRTMAAHYGYVSGTRGLDDDCVDVFCGPNRLSDSVWVIDQLDPKAKKLEQHKCMIGFDKWQDACAAYLGSFATEDDAARMGPVKKMSMDEFKKFLAERADKIKEIFPS